jgi:hypothetical protein
MMVERFLTVVYHLPENYQAYDITSHKYAYRIENGNAIDDRKKLEESTDILTFQKQQKQIYILTESHASEKSKADEFELLANSLRKENTILKDKLQKAAAISEYVEQMDTAKDKEIKNLTAIVDYAEKIMQKPKD